MDARRKTALAAALLLTLMLSSFLPGVALAQDPPTIVLTRPQRGRGTIDTTPSFHWASDGTGTLNHTLYVDTDADPYSGGDSYDVGASEAYTPTVDLIPGTTYYWGVAVTDDKGTTRSAVQSFTVLNQGQGGRIDSGIDNAHSVSDSIGGPVDIRLADLDGDGDLDMVAASRPDNAVFWYENTDGAGTFGPAQVITTHAVQATRVQIGDLDGDGDLDVVSASAGDDKIAWYANDGTGSFGAQQVITANAAGAQDVVLSDLDGDGDLDVVTASFYDDTIAWHENEGGGSFSGRIVVSAGSLSGPTAVNAADLNGDGSRDIIAFSKMDGRLVWYPNDGVGGFGAAQEVDAVGWDTGDNVEAADLDGDGDLDLLLSPHDVRWYENADGAGSFGAAQTFYFGTDFSVGHGEKAVAADLDGDGDPDVLSSGPGPHPCGGRWHRNDGTGNFDTNRLVVYYGTIGSRTIVRAGDIDGDGDLDVVTTSRLNRRIDWYENRYGAAPFVVDGVPDQTANVGVPYTHTIPDDAFDDLDDGGSLVYTATLAGGSPLPGWLTFDPGTDTFSGTPAAGDVGSLAIEVTAEDTDSLTGSDTFSLAVIDASGAPATQVTHTGDSGDGSLRQVVADAAAGDTITFAPELSGNTITFASGIMGEGSPAIKIDKSLTIDGDLDDDGRPDITLSGNQEYALFLIDDDDGACADVILDGLVLTDGKVADKFANNFGTVTSFENLEMRNCVIRDSSVPSLGSAIFALDGETVLYGCEVKNNVNRLTRLAHAGTLTFSGTRAEVVDCNIHGNSGYYLYGGGISARCELTVQGTTIRNNLSMFGESKYLQPALQSSGGGGIYFNDGDGNLTIEDSTIAGNIVAVGLGGGGVCAYDAAAVTIRDSRIADNYSPGNGGLKVIGGELTLERSTISGNTCSGVQTFMWGGGNVDYHGAGIWLDNVGSATIDSCTISDNMTPEITGVDESPVRPKYYPADITGYAGGGSGIYGSVGTLTLRNSTISGNTTYAGLGAVHRADTGGWQVYKIAPPTPGGLYLESGDAIIHNCTFAGNAGGGVVVQNGTYTIESSIFSGNIQSGIGEATAVDIAQTGGTLTATNSLVESANGGHGVIDGTDGNIVGVDPLLGDLADNGGPTLTHALLDGSPAIDAIPLANCAVDVDQRGVTRPRPVGGDCDMGAYEAWDPVLTVEKTGDGGGTVTSDPPGIDCGATCTHTFTFQTQVTLTATADADAAFAGWSGACSGTDLTTTVTMGEDKTCTATFNLKPGIIIVEKQTDPDGASGTFNFTDDIGTPLTFSLSDDQTRSFTEVVPGTYAITETNPAPTFDLTDVTCSDADSTGDEGTGVATVSLQPGETVTCTFTNTRQFTLTVKKAGTGTGTVTSDPAGINCGAECRETYDIDTIVTLTATPDGDSVFAGWSGDCSGTDSTTTVTMDADKTCTATFNFKRPVGGIVVPVNKLGLLALRLRSGQAPWMGLVALASFAALTVVVVRRRRR